jgi:hypothetical protein
LEAPAIIILIALPIINMLPIHRGEVGAGHR